MISDEEEEMVLMTTISITHIFFIAESFVMGGKGIGALMSSYDNTFLWIGALMGPHMW